MQQPVGDQAGALGIKRRFKGVHILVVLIAHGRAGPVHKADALFESGRGFPDEALLINAQKLQRGANSGEGAFAHANDADVGRLQHGHFDVAALGEPQKLRQIGGCQPTRRAAADDQDASFIGHVLCQVLGPHVQILKPQVTGLGALAPVLFFVRRLHVVARGVQ